MRVTIHQPDLLPYSGFWFKMATCDAFVLSVHDQFQKHGYQRRVTMRDTWCSHQLVGKPALVPINTVEVAPGWQQRITDVIRGRYAGSRHFGTRGAQLVERILAADGTRLDEVNLAMIEIVRDMLGITTPLMVTDPPVGGGTERLIEQVAMVGGTSYLAGQGGRAYMGDDAEERFAAAGLALEWSDHALTTGDSIATVLMDHDDPMEVVLRRG
jgi:WbqC-like protein family